MPTRLRQMIATIQAQYAGLSSSSKGLIASLVVILALMLGYVLMLTAQPDYVPLGLSAQTDDARRAEVVSFLQGRRVPHRAVGRDIEVPADQQLAVLDMLRRQELVGAKDINFDSFLSNSSVFDTKGAKDRHYVIAKMQVVERMVSLLDAVESANVLIDPASAQPGIGKPQSRASASVVVQPSGPGLSRRDGEYIAQLVAHAHAGMLPSDVSVTDARTMSTFRGDSGDGVADATEGFETKRAVEEAVESQIEELYDYIAGLKVQVNALIDMDQRRGETLRIEEARVGVLSEESRDRESTRTPPSGEPGVRANQPFQLASSATQTSSTESSSNTATVPRFPWDTERYIQAPGSITEINAVVQIPRSWFVASWQNRNGDPETIPDDATLTAYADAVIRDVTENVSVLIDTRIDDDPKTDGAVGVARVSMYEDGAMLAAIGAATSGGGGLGVIGDLVDGGSVGTISLAALAVVSLALMMMVVRNASRDEPIPSPEELVGIPNTLETDDDAIIGEVTDADIALEGREIDEDVVRREQILEYLNAFAKEDAEEAATLLRRWLRDDAL